MKRSEVDANWTCFGFFRSRRCRLLLLARRKVVVVVVVVCREE